jgi:hypothetical protein
MGGILLECGIQFVGIERELPFNPTKFGLDQAA